MPKILAFAALVEIATGLALVVLPSVATRLLLGEDATGIAIPLVRLCGTALIGLGVACWPARQSAGMLTYNLLATLLLGSVGLVDGWAGPMLWPVVAAHLAMSVLLFRALR